MRFLNTYDAAAVCEAVIALERGVASPAGVLYPTRGEIVLGGESPPDITRFCAILAATMAAIEDAEAVVGTPARPPLPACVGATPFTTTWIIPAATLTSTAPSPYTRRVFSPEYHPVRFSWRVTHKKDVPACVLVSPVNTARHSSNECT